MRVCDLYSSKLHASLLNIWSNEKRRLGNSLKLNSLQKNVFFGGISPSKSDQIRQ
jgi:hypothetical protein